MQLNPRLELYLLSGQSGSLLARWGADQSILIDELDLEFVQRLITLVRESDDTKALLAQLPAAERPQARAILAALPLISPSATDTDDSATKAAIPSLSVAVLSDCPLGTALVDALRPHAFVNPTLYAVELSANDSAALASTDARQILPIVEAPSVEWAKSALPLVGTPEELSKVLSSHDVVLCVLASQPRKLAQVVNEAALSPGAATCLFVAAQGDYITVGPAIYRGAAPCLRCADWAGSAADFREALATLDFSRPQVAEGAAAYRLATTFAAAAILKELARVAAQSAPGFVGQQISFFADGSTQTTSFAAVPGCPGCGRQLPSGAGAPPEFVWPAQWPQISITPTDGSLLFSARDRSSEASLLRALSSRNAAAMQHSGGTFLDHLRGVANILRVWGQPVWLQHAGLFHSIYGTDAFDAALFQPWERALVRSLIGDVAEHIVYLFCTLKRGPLWQSVLELDRLPQEGIAVENWRTGQRTLLPVELIAPLALLLLANGIEQSQGPEGSPGEWLEAAARMGRLFSSAGWKLPALLRELSIKRDDEQKLRTLYLSATGHIEMDQAAALEALQKLVALNPVVGEPYLLLGRMLLSRGDKQGAALIEKGRQLLIAWGTSWDKRATLMQWLGHCEEDISATQKSDQSDPSVFDPLVGITGKEAEKLFAPIGAATFLEEYFGKKPLHLRGAAEKYSGLFDRERFFAALQRSAHLAQITNEDSATTFTVRASFDKLPTRPIVGILPSQVEAMFRCDATICVNAISQVDPTLATFAAAVKAQLGYPGIVRFNAYWSPDGCGIRKHFDARVAMTLQLEGTKRWRYSKIPAIAWPRRNGGVTPDGEEQFIVSDSAPFDWEKIDPIPEDQYEEVELQPGDLLVLPAGCWHDCSAHGSSLSLNLAFEPQNFGGILLGGLGDTLGAFADWRSTSMTAARTSYVREQLQSVAATLEGWKEDDFALRKSWARFVMNWHSQHVEPAAPPRPPQKVEATHLLRLTRRLPVIAEGGKDPSGPEVMLIWMGSTELELTGDEERALGTGILLHKEFKARDCLSWPGVKSWKKARLLLAQLVEAGLLDVIDP